MRAEEGVRSGGRTRTGCSGPANSEPSDDVGDAGMRGAVDPTSRNWCGSAEA